MKEQIIKQQQIKFEQKLSDQVPVQQHQIQKYFQLLNSQSLSKEQYIQSKNQYYQIFKKNGFFLKQQFKSQIQIIYCDGTKSYEILQIDVQVGHLVKTITILNILKESNTHNQDPINGGAFGAIYQQHLDFTYIVKCIQFPIKITSFQADKQQILETLQTIFKQFFFLQLLSSLKIGPATLKPFGFDIIIYNECAQFFQQKCVFPIQDGLQKLEKDLINMHVLGIIHGDIKPQNIMYSQTYQKNVFIDFGLSRIVKQKIGFKTLSHFCGTLRYSSIQMRQTFLKQKYVHVDLFFNDAICLRNSIDQLKRQYKIKTLLNIQQVQQIQNNCKINLFNICQHQFQQIDFQQQSENRKEEKKKKNLFIYIKYLLYKRKRNELYEMFQKFKLRSKQQRNQIYSFIEQLPFDQFLSDFIYNILAISTKQIEEFIILQDKMKNNVLSLKFQHQNLKEAKYFRDLYNFKHKRINLNQKIKNQIQIRQLKDILLSQFEEFFDFQYHCQCYLKFVSFTTNLYNATIQDKIKASDIFLIKIKDLNQNPSLIKGQLQSIYLCFKYIENYLLEGQFTKWKKNNLINFYINKCILGFAYDSKQMIRIQKKLIYQIDQIYLMALLFFQTISIKQFDNNRIALLNNQRQKNHLKINQVSQQSNCDILVDKIKIELNNLNLNNQQRKMLNLIVKLCYDAFDSNKKEEDNKQLLQNLQEMLLYINRNQFDNIQLYLKCHQLIVIFNVRLHYRLGLDEGKIKKILNQIQSIYSKFTQFNCVDFVIIRCLFNSKNYVKLKKYLIKIDQTVNCQNLSNRYCISKRLALCVNEQNQTKVKSIILTFLDIQFNQFCPFIQFRQCLLLYQNLIYSKHVRSSGKAEILAQFESYFDKCICLIKYLSENKGLISQKQMLSEYKQLIVISLWICCSLQNQFIQNFLYSELNWVVAKKQHQKMKYQLIFQKANYLQRRGNIVQSIQSINMFFQQNCQIQKIAQNQQYILRLEWLCLHLKLKLQQSFQNFNKLQKIYIKLKQANNISFFYQNIVFAKQACKMLVLKNKLNSLIQFYESLSLYLSENTSTFNAQFLFKLIDYGINIIPSKNINYLTSVICQLQIQSQLWINPNFILVLHSVLKISYMILPSKSFLKLVYLISKNLNRIKRYVKQTVFQSFYLILSKNFSFKKKYYLKKHFKFYPSINLQIVRKGLISENVIKKWPYNIISVSLDKMEKYFIKTKKQKQHMQNE